MNISTNEDGITTLSGDFNIYIVKDLKTKLEEIYEKHKKLYIDLSKVTDIDTSCVQLLLALKILAKAENIPYKLFKPSDIVKVAFKLMGIYKGN